MEVSQITPKNTFLLHLRKDNTTLVVNSNFDSGNCAKAEIGLNQAVQITPANDCSTSLTPSHSKGWFYFSVSGVPIHMKVKFIIKKMSPMATQLKFADYFRPVFRINSEEWQRVEQAITKEDDTELHFDFVFPKAAEVYFAYSFPFSYEDCEKMLRQLGKEARNLKEVYYRDEVMVNSCEQRSVHLLTISSHDEKQEFKEERISQFLFDQGERPFEFKHSKRIVLISARVHPGQAPASHTFNGVLKFLLSNDARAHYLRKNFVFKLIPMLNPDGVFHGHHRMDIYGQNLNRFYLEPDVFRQPSVFAVKKLGEYYHEHKRLCFYVDLHAHPQKKGNFVYGNALNNPQQQVEAQLFAKLLSLNCIEFDYYNSSFSKYHMNAKDKNEDLSKQGCGRVVFNTHFDIKYAYTMQCGYTSSVYLNQTVPILNSHRKFERHAIIPDELENIKSNYYSKKNTYFSIRSYENLGKNIVVSILDLFQLNPASRISQTPAKHLTGVRQEILQQLNKASMTYIKPGKPQLPVTQGSIKAKPLLRKDRLLKGPFTRAPSIESNKIIQFNKLRNRTVAKVNIGNFM